MRIAVAGGTGVAGRHVVTALEGAGHQAVVLARSRRGRGDGCGPRGRQTFTDWLQGAGVAASSAGTPS